MKQQSQVAIGERLVTVVSELLLDPEVLVLTKVLDGAGAVLKKQHLVVPEQTARQVEERGAEAGLSELRMAHLRFVQRLLTVQPDAPPVTREAPRLPVGVLAMVALDERMQRTEGLGEHQVPEGWVQTGYRLAGLGQGALRRLGLGRPLSARAEGKQLAVVCDFQDRKARLYFVRPEQLQQELRTIQAHLEAS